MVCLNTILFGFNTFWGIIFYFLCPPLKKEGHIALHMSVGMSVGRYVGRSVGRYVGIP